MRRGRTPAFPLWKKMTNESCIHTEFIWSSCRMRSCPMSLHSLFNCGGSSSLVEDVELFVLGDDAKLALRRDGCRGVVSFLFLFSCGSSRSRSSGDASIFKNALPTCVTRSPSWICIISSIMKIWSKPSNSTTKVQERGTLMFQSRPSTLIQETVVLGSVATP